MDPTANLCTPFVARGTRRCLLDSTPIAGNAWQDGPYLAALDQLIQDDRESMADRRWALNGMDMVMGLDQPEATDDDVIAYCAGV